MSLLIKNGTVVNPAKKQNEVADVLVKDGKIAAIGQNLSAEGAEVYDATGLIVAPGLIDIHTHLREPGQEAKEDFHSGTQAAAAGGFTRVVTMANTNPVVDNAALVRGLQKQAELTGVVKVEFIGAVSKGLEGKELAEMGDMAEAGVVAFSDDGHYVENAAFMRRALEYSSMFNKMVIDHAEDITLTKNGHMHEGIVSYELGVIGRPAVAEDLAVARDILLSEMTGGHIHIAHVSSKNTVDMAVSYTHLPLAPNGLITTGLKKERQILNSVRHKADFIIDTTNMKTASLKEYLKTRFAQVDEGHGMAITVVSFGFKYGIPLDADMVWDVRFLPNPFYIPEFRHKTGRVKAVNEYIHSFEVTEEFKRRYFDTMDFLVPNYEQEGKSQFIVAVGCTGGMHRSVAMAEALYSHLLEKGYRVTVEHRDMMKNNVEEDYNPHEIITLDN